MSTWDSAPGPGTEQSPPDHPDVVDVGPPVPSGDEDAGRLGVVGSDVAESGVGPCPDLRHMGRTTETGHHATPPAK